MNIGLWAILGAAVLGLLVYFLIVRRIPFEGEITSYDETITTTHHKVAAKHARH